MGAEEAGEGVRVLAAVQDEGVEEVRQGGVPRGARDEGEGGCGLFGEAGGEGEDVEDELERERGCEGADVCTCGRW